MRFAHGVHKNNQLPYLNIKKKKTFRWKNKNKQLGMNWKLRGVQKQPTATNAMHFNKGENVGFQSGVF